VPAPFLRWGVPSKAGSDLVTPPCHDCSRSGHPTTGRTAFPNSASSAGSTVQARDPSVPTFESTAESGGREATGGGRLGDGNRCTRPVEGAGYADNGGSPSRRSPRDGRTMVPFIHGRGWNSVMEQRAPHCTRGGPICRRHALAVRHGWQRRPTADLGTMMKSGRECVGAVAGAFPVRGGLCLLAIAQVGNTSPRVGFLLFNSPRRTEPIGPLLQGAPPKPWAIRGWKRRFAIEYRFGGRQNPSGFPELAAQLVGSRAGCDLRVSAAMLLAPFCDKGQRRSIPIVCLDEQRIRWKSGMVGTPWPTRLANVTGITLIYAELARQDARTSQGSRPRAVTRVLQSCGTRITPDPEFRRDEARGRCRGAVQLQNPSRCAAPRDLDRAFQGGNLGERSGGPRSLLSSAADVTTAATDR